MIVFRLAKSQYKTDLSGKGAELYGGRWNSKGTPVVYCCDSIALCNVEVAVRIPLGIIPSGYFLVHIELPSNTTIGEINQKLPFDWNSYPHSHSTQMIGDKFVKSNNNLCLKVPSAAVQGNFNFLLNPWHSEMKKVKIVKTEAYSFDKRLFVR